MSDFFGAFNTGPAVADPWADLQRRQEEREDPYERNFLERVFAPFEAPQQTLFAATQNVAEDGFQFKDIVDSLGHGARYFNPWSNERPIDPNEIREVFMGENAEMNAGAKFGTNLAISLLYDPLLFVGLGKAVGVLQEGTNATRILRGVTNPAEEVIGAGIKVAKNQLGPAVSSIAKKVLGPARAEYWGTWLAQGLINKYAGVDTELRGMVQTLDQNVNAWRQRAYNLLKKAGKMRGPEAQNLLTEALESEAFYLARHGADLTDVQKFEADRIAKKINSLGINEDLFTQLWDGMRTLDDEIGEQLWKNGLISGDEFKSFRGTHLRRMFMAHEKPMDYIDRLGRLIDESPELADDIEDISVGALRRELNQFRSDFGRTVNARTGAGMTADRARRAVDFEEGASRAERYFSGSDGRFEVQTFIDDFVQWKDANSSATIDEVFEHIRDNMLGGQDPGGAFWKTMGNHLSNARYVRRGARYYQDRLRDMVEGYGNTWLSIQERMEIVSPRMPMRDEIREALGEITAPGARIASEASDAGRLVETRKFLDQVAGVQRVDGETGDMLEEVRRVFDETGRVPQEMQEAVASRLGRQLSIEEMLTLEAGAEVAKTGSRLASLERVGKFTVKMPDNPKFGPLAGMYVPPSTAILLRHMEGVGDIGNPSTKIAFQLTEAIRRGTGHFKVMKVAMDPTAQFRNLVGNSILMDMSGATPLRVDLFVKSADEIAQFMRKGEMGTYMELAEKAGLGLFQSTFSRQELMDIGMEIAEARATRDNFKGVFQSVYRGIQNIYGNVTQVGMASFEFNEQVFKMQTFMHHYDDMASKFVKAGNKLDDAARLDIARQAGAIAEQALFNYADVPFIADFARKYGVVPFITFPFKAVPYVAETLYKHPHRVLKYHRAVEEVNESLAGSPEDVAREVQSLPQHVRDNLVVKLPFEDNTGRPQYLDLAYFMPWYTIQDLKEQVVDPVAGTGSAGSDVGDFGLRGGLLTPPAMAVIDAIRRNEDSLGRPIVREGMSDGEKWGAMGKFMMEFWLPPSWVGGSRTESIGRALQSAAMNEGTPQDWSARLGYGLRLGQKQDSIRPAPGMNPQTQSQVNSMNPALGAVLGALTGGTVASDPAQAIRNERGAYNANASALARELARVRTSDLPYEEKMKRITRLQARLSELRENRANFFQNF